MASAPDDPDQAQPTEHDAFVRQLPKRIAAIEEIWSRLESGDWRAEPLGALYERVEEIAELGKGFALFQLNESALSLEVYLSSFVESDIRPDSAQIDAIAGLVRALKTAGSLAAAREERAAEQAGNIKILFLGEAGGCTDELMQTLQRMDCHVQQFADAEALVAAIQVEPPKAIVSDAAKLKDIAPLSAELMRMRTYMATRIPLVFVGESSALQLRVDAIRAGGDGYFVTPLDTAAVAEQIRGIASPEPQAPFRVLVVEDDPTQAEFAASILHKAGIEVRQVTEPVKVIDCLREFKPDLILMDIYMPDVNGIELTTIIRDFKEFVTIPIVFLSGEQNTEKQINALSVGGDDFVAKPIRPKHLLGIVQTRIRRARQLRDATGQPPKHDRVTGLFSRQHFLDRVAERIEESGSSDHAAVIILEPDRLATMQQTIGVGAMDHLWSEFGSAIAQQVEATDLDARIGEHTFGVLAKRASRDALTALAEHLVSQIAQRGLAEHVEVTASAGVCFIDDRHEDANGILSRARTACEQARIQGGNAVHVHGADSDSQETETLPEGDIEQRIKAALHRDAFVLQYQPMLDLRARGSEAYQVLLFVENAKGDLVGDRPLLELAEIIGLGKEIDQWLLDRAVGILKRRRESGRRTQILVHQSVHSALDNSLPSWLGGRLRAQHTVGTGLIVDFRLPDLSHQLKTAQNNIAALREMDVEVSLSRFPEKEAAFKVLRFLQAGYIKIAPRLLKADRQTISSVIQQAHDANAKVIVSNVDDPRSIDLHWSSGADFLQGNFIQRPLENMDYDFSQVVI